MLPQLPEPVRHPSVVRAAVSPSAAVVTAIGVGIGVAEQSVILAIVLGGGAWLGRMAVAVIQAGRRRRKQPDAPTIDPWAVPEPWRQYVRQALASRQRFDQTVTQWPAGPLHDRLVIIQPRLAQATEEVWAVARQGAALAGSTAGGAGAGPSRPAAVTLSKELRRIQAERQRAGLSDRSAALARSEEAVAAQFRAARRSEAAQGQVLDRLRLLTARLDEAVTELLELGLEPAGGPIEGPAAEAAFGSVDALVEEISTLHQGLREAGEAASGAGEPAGPPGLPAGTDGDEPATRPASQAGGRSTRPAGGPAGLPASDAGPPPPGGPPSSPTTP